jgi:glycosyltransferase involved in cell wall biosynthesis
MLKIAVVTRYFPSSAEPWQGRSMYQTLRLLARQADLRVFYPNASYPALLKPRSRTYDRLDRSYSPPGVPASYYDYPALPALSRPCNGFMAARTLLPHVRAFSPDLVFGCFVYPDGYAALKIAKALKVPAVVMSIGSDINSIGDPISAMHARAVLKSAGFLVTVSGDLRLKAIAMGAHPETTRAIVNGCDLSVFHPAGRLEARRKLGIEPGVEAVVYIGRMDVKKGLRELVEAAAMLQANRPRLHVYMVGAGPDAPLIKGSIQARNAAQYIHALPACAFDEVALWMAASNLITLPSYMEGCPNVVLEALASGRPVVATSVGGIPEILGNECGELVPPRDAAALANALDSVLDGNWDAAAIAARGSRSWDAVAAELLQVFQSLVPAATEAETHGR